MSFELNRHDQFRTVLHFSFAFSDKLDLYPSANHNLFTLPTPRTKFPLTGNAGETDKREGA